MRCLECYQEMDIIPGSSTECPNCGADNYVCCQCEISDINQMHCDDECGYICDSCRDMNDDFFSNDEM